MSLLVEYIHYSVIIEVRVSVNYFYWILILVPQLIYYLSLLVELKIVEVSLNVFSLCNQIIKMLLWMMVKTKSYSCVASGLLVRELLVRFMTVSHLTRQPQSCDLGIMMHPTPELSPPSQWRVDNYLLFISICIIYSLVQFYQFLYFQISRQSSSCFLNF